MNIIKDTDEQPEEEACDKVRKDPKCRSFCSCRVAVHCPLGMCLCPQAQKLSKPHNVDIFMDASSHRHDRLLTQSPVPLPSLEDGG